MDRGHFVQPAGSANAKPLFIVARTDVVRVFVDVPEMEAPLVERGIQGHILVQALPGQKTEGTVARTSWALSGNRTLRTELDLPNPKGLFRPGMYATAEIVLKERPNAISLPISAVVREGRQTVCCAVENGRIVRKPIILGLQTAEEAEALSGLSGEEVIVQTGADALREGQPVEVRRPEGR